MMLYFFSIIVLLNRIVPYNALKLLSIRPKLGSLGRIESFRNRGFTVCKSYRGDYEDDEKAGLSLKLVAVAAFGIVGLFGSDLFGNVNRIGDAVVKQARSPTSSTAPSSSTELKKTDTTRGAMTRLTRKEINLKLQQIPVFFAVEEGAAETILVQDGIGRLFIEKTDADRFVSSLQPSNKKVRVVTTTLNEVYYPLIAKKQKIGKFVEGVAGRSDATATYLLQPAESELQQTPAEWRLDHPPATLSTSSSSSSGGSSSSNAVPLFRVKLLAFEREGGLEIPLFLRREDALNSYKRLQEVKKDEDPSFKIADPEVQVTSLDDVVALLSAGGFEGRALEFYPSLSALEESDKLLQRN